MVYLITDTNANEIYTITNADNTKKALETFNRFQAWATETENKKFDDCVCIFLLVNTALNDQGLYKFIDF